MSSSPPREALMSDSLPCPECGAMQMVQTIENCHLQDGLTMKRLRHFKCQACDARFFDDEAMGRIQAERDKHRVPKAV